MLGQGESNTSIKEKLESMRKQVSDLEAELEPFVSSGAKLVTEAEL